MPLTIERFGTPERGSLFFLHGFIGTADDWKPIAEKFASAFSCHLVALPGHTHKDSAPIPSFSKISAALADALDKGETRAVHLIGYSMGGRIALAAAIEHQLQLASLTLLSSSPGLATEDEREFRRQSDEQLAARMLTEDWTDFLHEWYDLPLFASPGMTYELRATRFERGRRHSPELMADVLRKWGTGTQPSYWESLKSLPERTHLLVGASDRKFCDIAMHMHERNTQTTVHIIPNAGHAMHLDNPAECARIIGQIISGSEGSKV